MCGLVTLISKRSYGFANKELDVFEELLTVDQLRGQDATGAFCVHRNRQVSGIKLAATPWHLFKQPEYSGFRNKANGQGRILVGHNRKATQGAATNPANAHPFQEDNIILVHNGSLYNRHGLPDRDVDSHAVAAAFAKEAYDEVIKDLMGAFAFIWWDMKRNKLSVVRNKERPLWKLESKDLIVLCSEAWMGHGVLRRNGYGGKGEEFDVSEVPVDVIHHYEIGGKLVEEEGVKKAPVVSTAPKATTTSTTGAQGQASAAPTTATGTDAGKAEMNRVLEDTVKRVTQSAPVVYPFTKPSFRPGQRILVQVNSVRAVVTEGGEEPVFRAIGVTMEPGEPIVDFTGPLPHYVSHEAVERWMQFPVEAEIVSINTHSIRGPSVILRNFAMTGLVQTHPSRTITQKEWAHIVKECSCKKCNGAIGEYEPGFTSVKTEMKLEKRTYEVTCADCIEEAIKDTEVRAEFTNGRIDALQKWEQIGGSVGQGTNDATRVQGNSTTH